VAALACPALAVTQLLLLALRGPTTAQRVQPAQQRQTVFPFRAAAAVAVDKPHPPLATQAGLRHLARAVVAAAAAKTRYRHTLAAALAVHPAISQAAQPEQQAARLLARQDHPASACVPVPVAVAVRLTALQQRLAMVEMAELRAAAVAAAVLASTA
jgi:hypothetical protein